MGGREGGIQREAEIKRIKEERERVIEAGERYRGKERKMLKRNEKEMHQGTELQRGERWRLGKKRGCEGTKWREREREEEKKSMHHRVQEKEIVMCLCGGA